MVYWLSGIRLKNEGFGGFGGTPMFKETSRKMLPGPAAESHGLCDERDALSVGQWTAAELGSKEMGGSTCG